MRLQTSGGILAYLCRLGLCKNYREGRMRGAAQWRIARQLFLGTQLLYNSALSQNDSSKSAAATAAPGPQIKSYHDGGIRDIAAIGNRNVGCQRSIGNWYSLEEQVALGSSYSKQVEATSKPLSDAVITEYINRVGQNLVQNSDASVPFTIKVLDTDEINAFVLPGGFFYVDSGLILAAHNEAELAGVMAHEVAHVAACHAARQMSRRQLMNLATIPLIFVGGGIVYAVQSVAGLVVPLGAMKFSRSFESEADFLGVEYMYKAGYDPQALTSFFETLQAVEKQKPGTLAKAFAAHPQTKDRVKKMQREIDTLLPPKPEYKLDTSEFADVKARLAEIENWHAADQNRRGDGPILRRGLHDPGSDQKRGDDDQQPTLRRHD
jgi:predicted Zn-dependent protease